MNEVLNINNVHGYLDKDTGAAYRHVEQRSYRCVCRRQKSPGRI